MIIPNIWKNVPNHQPAAIEDATGREAKRWNIVPMEETLRCFDGWIRIAKFDLAETVTWFLSQFGSENAGVQAFFFPYLANHDLL